MADDHYCHGKGVTKVNLDTPDTPIGSTVVIDGQCYMKTGLEGGITHPLSAVESMSNDTCVSCLSGQDDDTNE